MGRRKKLTREELLEKKRLAEKARRNKIKSDPEAYQQYKEKERNRYIQRKETKKLIPIAEMTQRQQRNQRRNWKQNSRTYRNRQNLKKTLLKRLEQNTPPETDSDSSQEQEVETKNIPNEPHTSEEQRPLTRSQAVNTSQADPGPGPGVTHSPISSTNDRRKRYKCSKKIDLYKNKINALTKHIQALRKRYIRLKKKVLLKDSPRKNVQKLLADPNRSEDVKKALLFGEVVKNELQTSYELKDNKEKQNFKENMEKARGTLKKYKILNQVKRKTLKKVEKKTIKDTITIKEKISTDIRNFYENDAHSKVAAGKKECITRNKEKKQKRYLLDSRTNLHKKFLETQSYRISYDYFCKQKPFWVVKPTDKNRDTCQCKLHANIDLLLQALHKNHITQEKSHKELLMKTVCNVYNVNCLERKCHKCNNKWLLYMEFDNSINIDYWQWESGTKEVRLNEGTKLVKITEKKSHHGTPKDVVLILEQLSQKFYLHAANDANQQEAKNTLRNVINEKGAVIHMDFSENYATKYNTEVQSMHFGGSRAQITLHTSVIYMKNYHPQSFCTYSDCCRHDAPAVWAHILPILDFVKERVSDIETIEFITDSTCSQYRNKTINYIITKLHWHLENLKTVTWNYTEAGHGKGAPDGVGATLKRTADQMVNYGQDISDIDTFADTLKKSVKNVVLKYVSEYEIYEKEYLMPIQLLKPFKGMMMVHQIIWNRHNKNVVTLRRQTCTLTTCRENSGICPHDKHLGTYEIPSETVSTQNVKPVITDIVIITPKKNAAPREFDFQAAFENTVDQLQQNRGVVSAEPTNLQDNVEPFEHLNTPVASPPLPLAFVATEPTDFLDDIESSENQPVPVTSPPPVPAFVADKHSSDKFMESHEDVPVPVTRLHRSIAFSAAKPTDLPKELRENISAEAVNTQNKKPVIISDVTITPNENAAPRELNFQAEFENSMVQLQPSLGVVSAEPTTLQDNVESFEHLNAPSASPPPSLAFVAAEPTDFLDGIESSENQPVPVASPVPSFVADKQSYMFDEFMESSEDVPVPVTRLHRSIAFLAAKPTDLPKELRENWVDMSAVAGDPLEIQEESGEVYSNPLETVLITSDLPDSKKDNTTLNNDSSVGTLSVGSWVIVKYDLTKSTKHYIGQILSVNDFETFTVKFLRKVKGAINMFAWPEKDDEDSVPRDDIIKRITEPNINRRGQLTFVDIDMMLE